MNPFLSIYPKSFTKSEKEGVINIGGGGFIVLFYG
jgi:hypothetical protein